MRKAIYAVVPILLLTGSNASWAGTVICSGTVIKLAFHANDKLMLQLDSMNTPVFICQTNAVWSVAGTSYTTSPETCALLHSQFLTAKVTGIQVANMYFDGDAVPTACNAWTSWSSANIRHYVF